MVSALPPKADTNANGGRVRFGATSGLMHRSKQFRYLITSATRCESYRELEAGAVRVSFDAERIISSLAAR